MRTFFEYLWFLLPKPLKRTADPGTGPRKGLPVTEGRPAGGTATDTEIRRLVRVLAAAFDDAKSAVFRVRRAWLPQTAPTEALDLIGADRDSRRWPDEDTEAYRRRLLSTFDLYQQGGTVPGMILAMELLGYPNAKVAEPRTPRLYDGAYSHTGTIRYSDIVWAVFTVEIETPALSPERLDLILRTIDRWKPAHTMLAYLVLAPGSLADECLASDSALDLAFDHTIEISDLYAWPVAMYDGTPTHGGAVSHNGEMDLLDIEVLP